MKRKDISLNQGSELDPGDDAPDGVPVDAHEAADRRLVGRRRQEPDEILEVGGEMRAGPGKGDGLDMNAMGGTQDPSQARPDLKAPGPEVQVAPVGVDEPGVVAGGGAVFTQRAAQPASAQSDAYHHPVGRKGDFANPHPIEAEQARECSSDAHG